MNVTKLSIGAVIGQFLCISRYSGLTETAHDTQTSAIMKQFAQNKHNCELKAANFW